MRTGSTPPRRDGRMRDGTAFGAWLKQRRNALGLVQKELAEQAGCSAVMIEKIESGERRPSSQVAEMLAEALNVPADERRAFAEFARAHLFQDVTSASFLNRWQPL